MWDIAGGEDVDILMNDAMRRFG